jgi:hypothetical protein
VSFPRVVVDLGSHTFHWVIAPIPLAHRAVLGTATFRRLRDPAPLQALVARYLGLSARILSGEEEAALIWHGVQGWLPTQALAQAPLQPFQCPEGALVATAGSAISAQALGSAQGLPPSPISAAYFGFYRL